MASELSAFPEDEAKELYRLLYKLMDILQECNDKQELTGKK
jgi:hypothetical protein